MSEEMELRVAEAIRRADGRCTTYEDFAKAVIEAMTSVPNCTLSAERDELWRRNRDLGGLLDVMKAANASLLADLERHKKALKAVARDVTLRGPLSPKTCALLAELVERDDDTREAPNDLLKEIECGLERIAKIGAGAALDWSDSDRADYWATIASSDRQIASRLLSRMRDARNGGGGQ